MKRTETVKTMNIYALNVIHYTGAQAEFRFAFTAKNDDQANDKANKWARYQGFVRSEFTVSLATTEQAPYIRDEYMAHLR